MSPLDMPENELSRRYLRLVLRWAPVGLQWYSDWPLRPNCGHFLGGVFWYGLETSGPIAALAIAAASPEYDPKVAGMPREDLKRVCLKGLRYLCFTHDTGPADCVRPAESWGRKEPAGTKWGERGRGFFPESQCGTVIADLALTAALIPELIGEEERAMLRAIALDYMQRFEDMPPRSGVYWDTQTEENAWTAEGMAACIALLPDHASLGKWMDHFKRWAFRTVTTPDDARDGRVFADGKTVAELCGHTFTTHPDGTAENHAIVHPDYMASSIGLTAWTAAVLQVYGLPVPPHLHWRRNATYGLLKTWADDGGDFHCPQGMDWPYVSRADLAVDHATANLYYKDPDAALLERRALEALEQTSRVHGGRMYPEETARYCHCQQDPAIMRERSVASLALCALAHRLMGEGEKPSELDDFRRRHEGVYVYPQGGVLLHRHERGITSLAWRNCTMVLPMTRNGQLHVGPASGSMVATLKVKGRTDLTQNVTLKLREAHDRACALLVQDLAEGTVRRHLYFASLPDGRCLTFERLTALSDVTVEWVRQGCLCVMNDPYFSDAADHRARLTVHWAHGTREVLGCPAADNSADEVIDLSGSGWVNVDGRFGVVFRGTGRAQYQNQHHWQPWHAVKDDLTLNLRDTPRDAAAGSVIDELVALWTPHQKPDDTAKTTLLVSSTSATLFAAQVKGFVCACNFGDKAAALPMLLSARARKTVRVGWGVTVRASRSARLKLRLDPDEPIIIAQR